MKANLFVAALALTALGLPAMVTRAEAPAPAPNELVYLPQLPAATDLIKTAAAEGLTVAKIDKTSTEVVVTYKYPNGQINVVSYQLLPAAESAGAVAAVPAAVQVTTPAPSTAVVYQTALPGYDYSPYSYAGYAPYAYSPYAYYPWGWVAPVGISLGFGFRGGHGYYGHGWR